MNLGLAKFLDRALGTVAGGALSFADGLRAPGRPVERVEHLLIVKFWGLGNWALLRPVVRDLQARWSGARTTIATLQANEPLVRDLADDLLLVRPRGFSTLGADLLRGVRSLRRQPPDLAVDFEQFSRAGSLLARLGGAAQRVGFESASRARNGLYSVVVPFSTTQHASRSFRDLAEAAGVAPGPYVAGGLPVDPAARAVAGRVLPGRPYVVLHPGSGDNFPGRRWPQAGFAAVGRAAIARGMKVVVTGGNSESELAASVVAACGGGATSLAGRIDLPVLVAVIEGAEAVVSNDTGPVHIASALGTPTLAIYGPNTPVLYGPLAPGSRAFYRDLSCSPCLKTTNYRSSRCRIHTCTASISTGAVSGALMRLLDGERTGRTERGTWTGASS